MFTRRLALPQPRLNAGMQKIGNYANTRFNASPKYAITRKTVRKNSLYYKSIPILLA